MSSTPDFFFLTVSSHGQLFQFNHFRRHQNGKPDVTQLRDIVIVRDSNQNRAGVMEIDDCADILPWSMRAIR